MNDFSIKKATPEEGRILIAIAGQAGSGKTTSALRLAKGITSKSGGKILVIDTENRRALKYATAIDFMHMPFDPDFNPDRYALALKAAYAQGFGRGDVIIIDSMSHEHEGQGGICDMHAKLTGNDYKNSLVNWARVKPQRLKLLLEMQRSPCNLILCFRAKDKIDVKAVRDKKENTSLGILPIGGDEYFYEMNITMVLNQGSQGFPDWDNPVARINEFGSNDLKNYLKRSGQITEEMGAFIFQKECSIDDSARIKAEMTALFKSLQASIQENLSLDGLDADLDRIKSFNQKWHDALIALIPQDQPETTDQEEVM